MRRYQELEDRVTRFAKDVIVLCRRLPKDAATQEVVRQAVKAARSAGASYVEANEGISRKDFLLHVRIARKEARETGFWLRLLPCEGDHIAECERLIDESQQLVRIYTSIIKKCE